MPFAKEGFLAFKAPRLKAAAAVLIHIRTATKRVSSSRTNMKDSAGRRLGPKKYESSFVKPGQIIMRQRGTKIHPGDNVGLGKDHTIFALEPGYVRYYLDPFHPLRKYVGVALKKDVMLPYPHFEPRLRRFGYDLLSGVAADQEESRMSRKEQLAQPELQERAQKKQQSDNAKILEYTQVIRRLGVDLTEQEIQLGAQRLLFVGKHLVDQTLLERAAADQASFNYVHDAQLAHRRGECTAEEVASKLAWYMHFAAKFDHAVTVDFTGMAHTRYSAEALATKQSELRAQMQEYANIKLTAKDVSQIETLIAQPGVFSSAERAKLKEQYVPKVLPVTVPGTVVEVPEGAKLPKGVVPMRTYDPSSRTVLTVYRTKDAFLSSD
ncbi:hypothetical protein METBISCDRAFT_13258 [Metschnikowia bicuspidata]|uniref:Large ribosomal subunit protein bL27m n=1 Tax=Metschnikowia bicuspidata TaxID=27322 RepID=A0A4P9ZFN8_9ASCO|nr:hypothetical protein METBISCDRAFT_13258 [Metschnikowia bicuspidata]